MKRKTLSDLFVVFISNIFILVSGLLVSFFVPKIMAIDAYGYYKTFTLYVTYSSLLGLGFYEGLYLKYSGNEYKSLDKNRFRLFFRFYLISQIIVLLVFLIISFSFMRGNTLIIFISISIYSFLYNITSFFQILSQIVLKFKELSKRNTIKSVLNCLSIGIMVIIYYSTKGSIDYVFYILSVLVINLVLCVWYCFTYRDLIFGSTKVFDGFKKEIIQLYKIGIPLLIANICATLILTLDKQFVNILWPVSKNDNTYSLYAFAYNLLSLVTTLSGSMSLVLFPNLKQLKDSNQNNKEYFFKLVIIFAIFIVFLLISYYPICIFVEWFLPKYSQSLQILYIIYPGLAFSSTITVIFHNFYKLEGRNNEFFLKSLIILFLSFSLNLVFYFTFKTPKAISWASIISLIIWYLIIEGKNFFNHPHQSFRVFGFLCTSSLLFYCLGFLNNYYVEMMLYFVSIIFIIYIFFPNNMRDFFSKIKRIRKK